MCKTPIRLVLCLVIILLFSAQLKSDTRPAKTGAFVSEHELVLPGTPEVIYDAITGDVSGWWDHSFSENPHKFYIEAKPGGGFWEIFDEGGDGVWHHFLFERFKPYVEAGKHLESMK